MSASRTFVVDIEYATRERWQVWISEEPYRGAITDGDLPGERQKVGGGYTSRQLVASGLSKRKAERVGRRALKRARSNALRRVQSGRAYRAYLDANPPIRMTTTTEKENHHG